MRLGIDFGTTHTVVALVERGTYPVVSFGDREAFPSLIALQPTSGALLFGTAAEEAAATDPGAWRIIRSFKRLLAGADAEVSLEVAGRTFSLLDLLTGYLTALREHLHHGSNAGLTRRETLSAAVGVPANAMGGQRFLTVEAFTRAGFQVASLLNEPTAAGLEYAHRHRRTFSSRRESVLVYDLGGGTFDASVIHMAGATHQVQGTAGIGRLGGDDFDQAIRTQVREKAGLGSLPEMEEELLLEECRRRKEGIEPTTRRVIFDLTFLGAPPLVVPVEEVYATCAPLVERTLAEVEELVERWRRETGAAGEQDLAGIYTVGGGSGLPLVWRKLRERYGEHRVRRSLHPFAATAIGLAISQDESQRPAVLDRLTRHFGVWREEGAGRHPVFDVIFPREMLLPQGRGERVERVRRYRAVHNIGHFRYMECGSLGGGTPMGDLLPWSEIRVPFDPGLRREGKLERIPVVRLAAEGPWVEERFVCAPDGLISVTFDLGDGTPPLAYEIAPR
jgi:molecular chaperone DnaK (HSP70)